MQGRQRIFVARRGISTESLETKVVHGLLRLAPKALATNMIGRVALTLNNTRHLAELVTLMLMGVDIQMTRAMDGAREAQKILRAIATFEWESYQANLQFSSNELRTADSKALDRAVATQVVAYLEAAQEAQIRGISQALLSVDSKSIEPEENVVVPFFADNHRKFWSLDPFSNRTAGPNLVLADTIEDQAMAMHDPVKKALFALGANGIRGPLVNLNTLGQRVVVICHSAETYQVMMQLASTERMGQNGGWTNSLFNRFEPYWNKDVTPPASKKHWVHFLLTAAGGSYPVIDVDSGGRATFVDRAPLVQVVTEAPEVGQAETERRPGERHKLTTMMVDMSFGFRTGFADMAYQLELTGA